MSAQPAAPVTAAYQRWTQTWADAFGPHRGPCGLCGCPDARHREADAMVSRYLAGDELRLIAYDYEVADLQSLSELVAAGLAYEVARRRARLPRSYEPNAP